MPGIFRRPFWAPRPSQDPLGLVSARFVGPVNGTLAVTEEDDTLSATATDLIATLAATEADDVPSLAGVLDVIASAAITGADDTLVAPATLDLKGSVAVPEADDVPSLAGAVEIIASFFATEADDTFTSSAQLVVGAVALITEEDDTFSALALMPIFYPRRGGWDERLEFERRQQEWQENLRRIIDRSWRIASGEIDPITFEPIPPPDYSPVIGTLLEQALSLDRQRVEAFIAEEQRRQEDDAIAVLLLAA